MTGTFQEVKDEVVEAVAANLGLEDNRALEIVEEYNAEAVQQEGTEYYDGFETVDELITDVTTYGELVEQFGYDINYHVDLGDQPYERNG